MSDELEAAGALVTVGLAASEIEGSAQPGAAPSHAAPCANCGAALAGRFCSACGQPAHVHRSLLHLGEEVLHGILHFDAKGWRTLPLLVFRPGLLTRRYVQGQRARHVSPLALFLFSVFLMFFVFSLTAGSPFTLGVNSAADVAEARVEVRAELDEAKAAVARAEATLAQARRVGQGVAAAEAELESARAEQRSASVAVKAVEALMTLPVAASAAEANRGALVTADVRTGNARIDAALKHAQQNPELTLYKLKNTAYKYSFLLVPISLPFLWLMFFWRPGIVMYDHAVFALYSLSFMSVLFIAVALLEPLHASSVQAVLLLVVAPAHMFVHLLESYRLGALAALWRTAVLLLVCAVVLLLFLLLIVVVTAR
jgi:Protein of unknown function (DUF3667)